MAIAPILILLVVNLGQTKPSVALRSVVISFAVATLLWGGLGILLKDWQRAAILTTLLLALFYTYGHVYEVIRQVSISGITLGRHRYLGPTWFVLLLIGAWLIMTRLKDTTRATQALNFSAGVVIAIPLAQLAVFESQLPFSNTNAEAAASQIRLSWEGSEAPPDIYYILLDAYTGEDALSKTYGFDNRPFLGELSKLGFYIPSCTQSNYAQTEHTLASTLNLSYLDQIGDGFVADSDDRSGMWPLIRHSAVRLVLEELGYSTVAFDTGFRWSELDDADYYFEAATGPVRGLSAFEATLLRTTAAWILVDQLERLPPFLDSGRSAEEHYRRISNVLDQLREAPALAGPNFIFAHVVSPHLPFVFGPGGEYFPNDPPEDERNMDWYIKGYVDQVGVLNAKVLTALESIIDQSDPSPVIVLVGDHGPEMGSDSDRMSILYAVLLPGAGENISDQLNSPVNSFRVIFNSLFGTTFPILDHASLFSIYAAPYNYTLITNDCLADTTANHHP